MQQIGESLVLESNEETIAQCAHYWAIESPNGPTSRGVCKSCGEERYFKNSVQITSWESEGHDYRHRDGAAERGL